MYLNYCFGTSQKIYFKCQFGQRGRGRGGQAILAIILILILNVNTVQGEKESCSSGTIGNLVEAKSHLAEKAIPEPTIDLE